MQDTSATVKPYIAAVEAAITEQMRKLLHDPAFQALEAAWRGVQWLISSLELDENLELHLFDVSREELLADVVAANGQLAQTGLYRALADRWRNVPDLPLRHVNGPDHYIDIEELEHYEMKPEMLPVFRYDFVAQLALCRKANPEKFPAPEPGRNEDRTRELVGLLPWSITEHYARLKSGFSYLKAYLESGGTAEEITNAQENIIYVMGAAFGVPALPPDESLLALPAMGAMVDRYIDCFFSH